MNHPITNDLAEDKLDAIRRIKTDFFDLAASVEKLLGKCSHTLMAMEQELDELLLPEFRSLLDQAGYHDELPISTRYTKWLREQIRAVPTNPATYKEMGIEI